MFGFILLCADCLAVCLLFVLQLADFGLMKVMAADKGYLRNMSISGTITHVAPERLEVS